MSTYNKTGSNTRRILWLFALLVSLVSMMAYFYLYPESLPKWAAKTPIGQQLQTTTVYKWQDESGRWHVSDQPPPAGTKYQVEDYGRDINILPLPPELQQ